MQMAAAIQNMLRQPSQAPMAPLSVRESSMPISKTTHHRSDYFSSLCRIRQICSQRYDQLRNNGR